jgi:diguanylate cyclase (GGDEF)-like protein/PAS domain S-box-containing protein
MPTDAPQTADILTLATEAADVGVWFWDIPSDTQHWSDRCKAHLVLPAGEAPTMAHFFAVMHPDDRERVREAIHRSQKTHRDYREEYRIIRPDGEQHWIAGLGRTYCDPTGQPASMVGVTLDITRLKQAQQDLRLLNAGLEARIAERTTALNAESDKLKAMLDGLIDPHMLCRPIRDAPGHVVDFTIVYANPAAATWYGIDRHRLIGSRLLAVSPFLASTSLFTMLAATADTGRPTDMDAFAYPHDRTRTRWLDIRAVQGGDQISLTWRDVTEQHDAAVRIAASEERFRLLAENSSDVVMRTDATGRIAWVSSSLARTLGWSPAEWIGRTASDVFGSDADREDVLRDYQQAMTGHSIVTRARLPAKENGVHWVEIHAGPSRTTTGDIDGIVASFRIVDKEVEAERILQRRARTDDLTALLNRNEALERIETLTRRTGRTIAVLSCDIDRFKTVNDRFGHAVGDTVLREVGSRIRESLRSGDDIGARVGGDELLVVLHGVRDLDDAWNVAEKLRRRAAEPIPTPAGPVAITVSIGVTLARPFEAADPLLARADRAMYEAKNRGRDRVVAAPEMPVDGQ